MRLQYPWFDQWAEFVVDPLGTTVWISWSASVFWEEVSELFLGPVFSSVLSQRGQTCLHAGVVRIRERGLAVVGPKGSGKSTLSLALIRCGGALVSDDVAVLGERGGHLTVPVGAPRLRILRDSAEALGGSFDELEPVWERDREDDRKRYLEVPAAQPSSEGAVTLDAVYFLGERSSTHHVSSIRHLRSIEALPRLMANRHMVHVLNRDAHTRDFRTLSRLARAVRLGEIERPEDLSSIERCADDILADLGA